MPATLRASGDGIRSASAVRHPSATPAILDRMSEYDAPPPEEGEDDVTVGAWLDLDQDRSSAEDVAPDTDVMPEPTAPKPSLWARITAALRGGSSS
jgi:hypothetical protein